MKSYWTVRDRRSTFASRVFIAHCSLHCQIRNPKSEIRNTYHDIRKIIKRSQWMYVRMYGKVGCLYVLWQTQRITKCLSVPLTYPYEVTQTKQLVTAGNSTGRVKELIDDWWLVDGWWVISPFASFDISFFPRQLHTHNTTLNPKHKNCKSLKTQI